MVPPAEPLTEHEALTVAELRDAWPILTRADRQHSFTLLDHAGAEEFFLSASSRDQHEILFGLPAADRRTWLRLLAPDDAADLVQQAPRGERDALLALLDDPTRHEVAGLLAYAEDNAGGLMNPRYARLRLDMTVDEAVAYLRRHAREHFASLYYAYVLDPDDKLLGVVSLRDLFRASAGQCVRDVMRTAVITALDSMDQAAVSRLFSYYSLVAIPVVDQDGRMKGIVTADDVVNVVEEAATKDIQKIGGMEALDAPYLEIGIGHMLRRRAGWLSALFLGEMLTATAMGYYEDQIARAVVLALFVPLIISSGGNSGSQATTLVIRAMALGEVRLRDWWRVVRREFFSGLGLGCILGSIGLARILLWEAFFGTYGPHYVLIALTVATSLVGVVLWGTLAGSMLPFLLRRLGFDPASASAPFVATLVDVSGLVIYFTTATLILSGTLL
jgi:magnesium transporter